MIQSQHIIYASILSPYILLIWQNNPSRLTFLIQAAFSLVVYFMTNMLIPQIKSYNLKADLFGMDINKKGTDAGNVKVPESMGIVPATLYLIFVIVAILGTKYYNPSMLFEHAAGVLSICFIVFLGFSDDVLDLPWRYKLILPTIASLPILVAYTGATTVLVPLCLRDILGNYYDLGLLYYIYMGMLSVFCTNSINIYAGINGLEVGQSIIIAASILIHNFIEIDSNYDDYLIIRQHLFSIFFITPYIFTSLALFNYNKYPSSVFVGDIFCYWSGMTFAVAGILGHFSKTLLLFFIPQILNFVFSLPQLFKIIPCPRHRLPKYNQVTGKLEAIKTNLTLINFTLWLKGPTTEEKLCEDLLIFQMLCSIIGFVMRYYFSQYFF